MVQFSYSFCMALLHSFWQAALLALLYFIVNSFVQKQNTPLAKRNFLYVAIVTQLILFAITFSIYIVDITPLAKLTGLLQPFTTYLSINNFQWLTPWVFGLYVFIIIFKMAKAIYAWQNFKQQYKSGLHKPTVDLKFFTELKALQFGIKRKVKIWLSSSVNTPITFGYFRPIILLPVALVNHISIQQAETLILHELTHIRTNDYLLNWFLIIAESIFFFNPFIISLCNKIRLEREKHCDIQVISFKYSPALYAQTLLQAERMKQLVPGFQLAAVNKKKHLLKRIQFFTNEKYPDYPFRYNIAAPFIGLVLLLILSTAILFQAGNKGVSTEAMVPDQFLPFNNYMPSTSETETAIIANNKPIDKKITGKAMPVEHNKVKLKIKPTIEREAENKIIDEPIEMNFAIPVTISENDAARQIIIKEEGSGSSTLKTYYLSFENGKWILQPEWEIIAKELRLDSLSLKLDSLNKNLKKIYAEQQ